MRARAAVARVAVARVAVASASVRASMARVAVARAAVERAVVRAVVARAAVARVEEARAAVARAAGVAAAEWLEVEHRPAPCTDTRKRAVVSTAFAKAIEAVRAGRIPPRAMCGECVGAHRAMCHVWGRIAPCAMCGGASRHVWPWGVRVGSHGV